MMFEDTIKSIHEARKNLLATEQGVEKARERYNKLDREITNASARLRRKQGNEHISAVANRAIKSFQRGNLLQSILISEIDEAALGTEFEDDVYLSKLYMVANSKDIYKLFVIGSGWNTHLATQIVFEEDAGRLADYARGINTYRASLKTKIGGSDSNRGLKATSWWLEHVHGRSLQERTVDGRVGVSGRPAPFWQLLDAGSQPLASDRPDGSYNPFVQPPTGFIGKAERRINKEFDDLFKKLRAVEEEEARELKDEIERAKEFRDSYAEDVALLETDYVRNQSILRRLEQEGRYADENLLAKVMKRIDNAESLPDRVNIRNAGKDYYISVKKLKGFDL